jgi:hypothetical protein
MVKNVLHRSRDGPCRNPSTSAWSFLWSVIRKNLNFSRPSKHSKKPMLVKCKKQFARHWGALTAAGSILTEDDSSGLVYQYELIYLLYVVCFLSLLDNRI